MAPQISLTPVHFFSHGSIMMLGEESASVTYWEQCGDEALANGNEHVIIMGAHWAALSSTIEVSTNLHSQKPPVAYVHPSTPDRVLSQLRPSSFDAHANPTFDWIHDSYLILIRMFPAGCPPTTIISMNARYDPHFHLRIGAALRPLRARSEKTLLIGSGGAGYKLYRNNWAPNAAILRQLRDVDAAREVGIGAPPGGRGCVHEGAAWEGDVQGDGGVDEIAGGIGRRMARVVISCRRCLW